MPKIKRRYGWIIGITIALIVTFSLLSEAGSLEPPGAPAPTMRTIDEVEPRTPIYNSDLPLTISSSGSYYLAENIPAANGGITVSASNVTIDLMGFSFCNGGSRGIYAEPSTKGLTVKNGTVCGWSWWGIETWDTEESHILNVHANGNADGIRAGRHSVVSNCIANNNSGKGFVLQYGTVISSSVASNNGSVGIECPLSPHASCSITGCVVEGNKGDGIWVSNGGTISDTVAARNSDDGIYAGSQSTVIGCSAMYNEGDGIEVFLGSLVLNNVCADNGQVTGDGAGIHATEFQNRIEGNLCRGNTRGIEVDGGGNFIVRNTVAGNLSLNYDIVAGNDWAQNTPTTAGPWDNLTF